MDHSWRGCVASGRARLWRSSLVSASARGLACRGGMCLHGRAASLARGSRAAEPACLPLRLTERFGVLGVCVCLVCRARPAPAHVALGLVVEYKKQRE